MIKGIYSAVITENALDVVRVYTDYYGYLIAHTVTDDTGIGPTIYVLENEFSQRFDVIEIKGFKEKEYAARINVDDFYAALSMYRNVGFECEIGPLENKYSRYAVISRNKGSYICLMEHVSK